MARMIPSQLSPEIKSNAEKRVFEWFRDDPEISDWYVLHSLGIANHRTIMFGEIDFVVLAPGYGVFALEVKGGRISRNEGLWFFTDKYGNTGKKTRSPFQQASEGIFSLFDMIKKRKGENHTFSRLIFGSGVIFPDIEFNMDDFEVESWQIFDKRSSCKISDFIKKLSRKYIEKYSQKYGYPEKDRIPDRKIIKELASFLRGDFEKVISLTNKINLNEQNLITLTSEQLRCIDQLEDNPRCLIFGPAGTGKTLLALEAAKKAVINKEKVAFFFFNNILGKWLNYYFDRISPSMKPSFVGTFHSFMLNLLDSDKREKYEYLDKDHDFFIKELPDLVLERIIMSFHQFDRIVVDEIQDIITKEYLDILDLILLNGLDRGKWCFFGDLEKQLIFNSGKTPGELIEMIENRTMFAKFRLKINCRNSIPIGEEISLFTGVSFEKFNNAMNNDLPLQYIVYDSLEDQKNKIEILLNRLIKTEKLNPQSISLLSPFSFENSVISQISLPGYPLNQYNPDIANEITFSTIHSFKGLENSVIIITDFDSFSREELLYVGFSRARSVLYIFESEKAEYERKKILKEKVFNEN